MQFVRIMVHIVVKLGSTVTPSTNVFSEVLVLCKALLPSSMASGGRGSSSAFLLQARPSLFWQDPGLEVIWMLHVSQHQAG